MVRLGYDGEMSCILDGIFVGRYRACRNKEFLQECGITHVINCAAASCQSMFPDDFTYLNLPMKDEPLSDENIHLPLTPLDSFIPAAAYFIQKCLDEGGRVVVHCRKGVSRSVSIVIGYLMLERGANLAQALTLCRERRKVADPNIWFVEDLKNYQFKLRMERATQGMPTAAPQQSSGTEIPAQDRNSGDNQNGINVSSSNNNNNNSSSGSDAVTASDNSISSSISGNISSSTVPSVEKEVSDKTQQLHQDQNQQVQQQVQQAQPQPSANVATILANPLLANP